MFTFVTISYNQENFILEHLESIKYQIEKFANGRDIYFVLSDDGSKDHTVEYAREWLEKNAGLFKDVTIMESGTNRGIVYNYLRGINAVKTEQYKCIAADDLYYTNNVIDAMGKYDIVLSPTIYFNNDGEILHEESFFYYGCAGKSGDKLIREIKGRLSYFNGIHAPGAFVRTNILQDHGLQEFMRTFKWIEDYPQWYYIFNNYEQDISVYVSSDIYVMYRVSAGITTNKNIKNQEFENEAKKIRHMFRAKMYRCNKYINPYRYLFFIKNYILKYFKMRTTDDVKKLKDNAVYAEYYAPSYLCYLNDKVKSFYNNEIK